MLPDLALFESGVAAMKKALIIFSFTIMISASIASSLLMSSCVAGASRDTDGEVRRADEFKESIAPGYEIKSDLNSRAKEQHIGKLLSEMRDWTVIQPGTERDVSTVKVRFSRGTIKLILTETGDTKIINFSDLFDVHPIEVAFCTVGKEEGGQCLVMVNKSRASTGLYAIAIFSMRQGDIVYQGVLRGFEVWDISEFNDQIIIIGNNSAKIIRQIDR
jgi:hypothetical protein